MATRDFGIGQPTRLRTKNQCTRTVDESRDDRGQHFIRTTVGVCPIDSLDICRSADDDVTIRDGLIKRLCNYRGFEQVFARAWQAAGSREKGGPRGERRERVGRVRSYTLPARLRQRCRRSAGGQARRGRCSASLSPATAPGHPPLCTYLPDDSRGTWPRGGRRARNCPGYSLCAPTPASPQER